MMFVMRRCAPGNRSKLDTSTEAARHPSRAEQLVAAFRKAAKRAIAEHAAAGRSVFGKLEGRLREVFPTPNK
jgi:plasmid stabilization system protein ParE